MTITVPIIKTNDGSDFAYIETRVDFWDETSKPHFSTSVVVFIEKADLSVSQIKERSIDAAKNFLQRATA
jgi:hypothetical protein